MTLLFLLSCDPAVESVVGDVPVAHDDVLALASPPDVTVAVERRTVHTGGAACAAPVCLVLVPILLVSVLFPEEYDEVTVTTRGVVTWSGTYTTDGDFIQARVRDGDRVRDLRRLDLDELNRRIVVEVAEGTGDTLVPTPILPQIDLLAQYDANLRLTDDAERRGRLIAEAWTWLGDESVPWVEAKLRDEPDVARAAVMRRACQTPEAPGRDAFLAAVSDVPGPATAEAALACFPEVAAGADPFVYALAREVCVASDPCDAITRVPSGERADLWTAAALSTCAEPAPRVLYQQRLHVVRTPAEVKRAILAEGCLARALDADDPDEREGMIAALLDPREMGGDVLNRLAESQRAPDADEAEAIARAYLRSILLENTTQKRTTALVLLHRATDKDKARAILSSIQPAPFVDAGRVVVGDTYRALPAAKGLDPLANPDDATGEAWVVVSALRLAGCDDDGIRTLAAEARKNPDGTGAGCAR